MKLVGWTYIEDLLPWIKVFESEIHYDKKFSNIPVETIDRILIQCDLYGYVNDRITNEISNRAFFHMLDLMFKTYSIDLKEPYRFRQNVKYDGNAVKLKEDIDFDNFAISTKRSCIAHITLINDEYAYFNCTSYEFYDPIKDFVMNTLKAGCGNLGGWFVKIGAYEEIDSLLKDIL